MPLCVGEHRLRGHAVTEQDATDVGWQTNRHSRFEVAAPRHFLLPAILLLLAEEPRHGYSLAKGVHALQVGRVDRPSVYRALAQLEADGLIGSSPEHQRAGHGRRRLQPDRPGRAGAAAVDGRHQAGARRPRPSAAPLRGDRHRRRGARRGRRWLARRHRDAVVGGVVDLANRARPTARLFSAAAQRRTRPAAASATAVARRARVTSSRFRVVPDRSVGVIDARSSVGPITFGAVGVTGVIEAAVAGRRVCPGAMSDGAPRDRGRAAFVRATASTTPSCCAGSTPAATRPSPSTCGAARPLGATDRYQLSGEVTFHGVSRPLEGTVVGGDAVRAHAGGPRRAGRRHPRLRRRVTDGADAADLSRRRRRLADRGRTRGAAPTADSTDGASYDRKRTRWECCWCSQPAT